MADPAALGSNPLAIAVEVESCRARLGAPQPVVGPELDAVLHLLSWNVRKGSEARWRAELALLASDRDLVLIQEAVLEPTFTDVLPQIDHWAFGPGYRDHARLTGVMTLSRVPPLAHCYLTTTEPWLKTPKATMVTRYGIAGTAETLVVVNLHAVNFSVGLAAFRAQMDQVREALRDHRGPLIVAGDFNTWRGARMAVVERLADDLDLQPLAFGEDRRKFVFGLPLDHVFVRGLVARETATHEVGASDHNALSAVLAL